MGNRKPKARCRLYAFQSNPDLRRLAASYTAVSGFGCIFFAVFHSVAVFGGGLILSIMLALVIGSKAVVPVIAVSLLVSHTSRVWAFGRGFTWPVYRNLMTTAFPGIIVGAVVYSYLPTSAIAALMGVF